MLSYLLGAKYVDGPLARILNSSKHGKSLQKTSKNLSTQDHSSFLHDVFDQVSSIAAENKIAAASIILILAVVIFIVIKNSGWLETSYIRKKSDESADNKINLYPSNQSVSEDARKDEMKAPPIRPPRISRWRYILAWILANVFGNILFFAVFQNSVVWTVYIFHAKNNNIYPLILLICISTFIMFVGYISANLLSYFRPLNLKKILPWRYTLGTFSFAGGLEKIYFDLTAQLGAVYGRPLVASRSVTRPWSSTRL